MEWLTRVRKGVMTIGTLCGCPAVTVWHGFQTLQEMKAAGITKVLCIDLVLITCMQLLTENSEMRDCISISMHSLVAKIRAF